MSSEKTRRRAVRTCVALVLAGAVVAGVAAGGQRWSSHSVRSAVANSSLLAYGAWQREELSAAHSQPTGVTRANVVAQIAAPTYTSGALSFGPPTVVDFQRTEGEPLGHIDKDGNYWESGPWGFSTAQSFIHRSIDGGDQFNVVSPVALRPNSPPGGGDSTIVTDDQGYAYFSDLEALADIDCSVSWDGGNSWTKQPECAHTTGTDRNWLIVDNGPTPAQSDNTVFFAYHDVATGHFLFSSPGSAGPGPPPDTSGGLVFTNAVAGSPTTTLYSGGGNCAQLTFDPLNRNLYYACGGAGGGGVNCPQGPTGPVGGKHIDVTIVHVNPGARTGLTKVTKALPNTPMCLSNLFPVLSVDSAGNVYVVWSDTGDHNIYYSYSTDQGTTWSQPIRVNNLPGPATSTAFAWSQAGAAGRLAAIYLQVDSDKVSDEMPNWNPNPQNNPPGGPALATQYKWFGHVSLITDAATPNPTIDDNAFTEKPSHYGQICNSGIGCTATFGDRTMADYLSVQLDKADGALRIVYDDTTSQYHGAHVFETRQLSGPALTGGTVSRPAPTNPMADAAGDAQSPHYAPAPTPKPNQAQLDLRSLAVNQQDPNTLRFRITLENLGGPAGFLPPPGKASAFAMVRFQALSRDDTNTAEAYRVFYVGVEAGGSGIAPFFFAGSPTRDPSATSPTAGCQTTTPGTCKVVQYPPEIPLTSGGTINGNTICIDVPLSQWGANRPINGTKLYNVTAFTGGRNNPANDIFADVDSTRTFDLTLGTVSPTTCTPPTAVLVRSFAARAEQGRVVLRWRTGAEASALGFNVWRRSGSREVKLNRTLIAAHGSLHGASYRFVDRRVSRGKTYSYRLELVGRAGERSSYGRARVRVAR